MELDLELEWELKWELEWELVLKPRNPREFQPGAQKSALWAKMALLSIFAYENGPLGAFLEPLSQPGKSAIRSRRPATQFQFSVEDSH